MLAGVVEQVREDLLRADGVEVDGDLFAADGEADVGDALLEIVTELGEQVAQDFPGIELRGEDVVAQIDAARAQQVFSNIADNARKHGRGAITIDLASENGEAVVRVSDEGPGIPPAELDRIFNRFYRVDRSRSQPGTGLGLAIAKRVVERHRGSIAVTPREGGGTVVTITLPVAAGWGA